MSTITHKYRGVKKSPKGVKCGTISYSLSNLLFVIRRTKRFAVRLRATTLTVQVIFLEMVSAALLEMLHSSWVDKTQSLENFPGQLSSEKRGDHKDGIVEEL